MAVQKDTLPLLPGEITPPRLPGYLQGLYNWAYVKPRNVRLLDHGLVVNTILFGNMYRLTRAACVEINKKDTVLQPAAVYGSHLFKVMEAVGYKGRLDVLDVTPIQVKRWMKKFQRYPQANIFHADAENPVPEKYDVINCFFLLHELPDGKKKRVLDNLLSALKPSGRLVVIDYHGPHRFHPLRFFLLWVNRLLEPFAESLWKQPVRDFVSRPDNFVFTTETFFGGLYQKTIIRHKAS